MSNDATITFTVDCNIGIITLNLPKKLNALTTSLYYHLGSLMRQADRYPGTLVTLVIGTGRFFSIGADFQADAISVGSTTEDTRRAWLPTLVNNTVDIPSAFFSHSKILICALNGPVIGLSAALISHADFIYAVPQAYLLTPFGSLGLVSEGGASTAFVRRMGLGLANEALLKGRKITAEELKAVGFVSNIVPAKNDLDFKARVLEDIKGSFGINLVPSSVLEIKRIMRRAVIKEQEGLALDELFTGVKRFAEGIPQAEIKRIMTTRKKHKI